MFDDFRVRVLYYTIFRSSGTLLDPSEGLRDKLKSLCLKVTTVDARCVKQINDEDVNKL